MDDDEERCVLGGTFAEVGGGETRRMERWLFVDSTTRHGRLRPKVQTGKKEKNHEDVWAKGSRWAAGKPLSD